MKGNIVLSNVDLPVYTLMRTKFAECSEYHLSFDTLNRVVNIKGLDGGFNLCKKLYKVPC